ncbi:MAG: winged helix-turn-helix transcriptional regulator [Thermoplasmata archaeon]
MKEPLELANRKRIYEIVRENPGMHFRELQRRTGMPTGVLSYHLDYLVQRGLLTVEKGESFSRYFPQNVLRNEEKRILAALRQEIPRGIILFLLLNPGATHGKVLQNFTISPGTLSYHIKKLASSGLIKVERVGRESRMTVIDPDRVSDLLIVYRRSFMDRLVDEFVARYLGAGRPPTPSASAESDARASAGLDSTCSSQDRPGQSGPPGAQP